MRPSFPQHTHFHHLHVAPAMDHSLSTVYLPFILGAKSIELSRVPDGERVAAVPLGHALYMGTCKGGMIATIGRDPSSVIIIIINDRHGLDHLQLLDLPDWPMAVAISPAQDTVAVVLNNGMVDDAF